MQRRARQGLKAGDAWPLEAAMLVEILRPRADMIQCMYSLPAGLLSLCQP